MSQDADVDTPTEKNKKAVFSKTLVTTQPNVFLLSEWCQDSLPQVQFFGSEEIQNWCESCGVSVNKYLEEEEHILWKL